jgi:SAM-dependent methyltransferase
MQREDLLIGIIDGLNIPSGPVTIAEMGVGRGDLTILLRRKFPQAAIISVDKNIKYFRERIREEDIVEITLLEEDLTETSLKSDSIDFVFYFNMIRHLEPLSLIAAFKEARRLVTDKGRMIIIDQFPASDSMPQKLMKQIYDVEAEIDILLGNIPERLYHPDAIKRILAAIGLEASPLKIFDEIRLPLPETEWHRKKESLLQSLDGISTKNLALCRAKIEELSRKIGETGLEMLSYYLLAATTAGTDK